MFIEFTLKEHGKLMKKMNLVCSVGKLSQDYNSKFENWSDLKWMKKL